MKIKYIVLILLLVNSLVMSTQAHRGVKIFTQPDGTQFEGVLRGDSSFHWIQSNGNIVVLNPKDKYYYIANSDTQKGLVISTTKPKQIQKNQAVSRVNTSNKHTLKQSDKEIIYYMYKSSKRGNYPR